MSISIDNAMLSGYAAANSLQNSKTKQLEEALTSKSLENADDKELMEACKSFESYFVEQAFKEMKQTVHSDLDDNEYMKYFGDMMSQEYAKSATEGQGLGIAQMLFDSMKRQ